MRSPSSKDGGPAAVPADENVALVSNNGPLYLKGDLRVSGAAEDMSGVRYRAALCRCGKSARKPFCDNSHEQAGFRDYGAVGQEGDGIKINGGPLEVSPAPNGPLVVSGNLTIVAGSGRRAWQGTKVALCRCGESENRPFCDGAHARVGFEAG
ncbi:MAG: CDGSH iron-sulfur domain-containing protein [Acidobacteriota bacterium]|nr:CDGSH iron-sulfur domain-containing protein [Acidobacteriota bacterium]